MISRWAGLAVCLFFAVATLFRRQRMRSVLLLFYYYQEDCDAEFYTDFYFIPQRRRLQQRPQRRPDGDAHCNLDDDYGDVGGRALSCFGRIGNALCGGNGLRRERHRSGHDDFR